MRTAFVSLIAAAGLALPAAAQETTTAPAAQPAPDAAAPAAQPMPAAPAEEPAPPPPTLPTTGDGAAVLQVLTQVCVPFVKGGNLDQLAKAQGFKANKRYGTYTRQLAAEKGYTVTINPLSASANGGVCEAEIHYVLGGEAAVYSALNVWSFLHEPELVLQANYVAVDPDGLKRVRRSWEAYDERESTGVNFTVVRKPDDSPVNAKYDTGVLRYQERKF